MKVLLVCKSKVMENLGVMYLSSVIKKAGHECKIVSINEAIDSAQEIKPDIVGFSIMTGDMEKFHALEYSLRKRKHPPKIIVGGPDPTFFPKGYDWADEIAKGDAEGWMLQYLSESKAFYNDFFHLDFIPWPDRTDFPGMKIRDFITSRGCPYSCLTGDAVINTPNGDFFIKDLVGKNIKVLTRNPVTEEPIYADAINIRLVEKNAKLVRVFFDDGSHIDCTPDHKFKVFKAKNQYIDEEEWDVEAKDLKPKQSVRAVSSYYDGHGRLIVTTKRRVRRNHSVLIMESLLGRRLLKGEVVHHKDKNPSNDAPENLILTTSKRHLLDYHPEVSERMKENNPVRLMPKEALSQRAIKYFRGRKQGLEERKKRSIIQRGENNSNWRGGFAAKKQNKPSRIINHKVIGVRHLDYTEDVYCMEVPSVGWFYANKVLVKNCAYCYNDRWNKMFPDTPKVRTRSVKDVIAEINATDPDFVYFQDSCFAVNMNWMRQFSELYRMEINIPYHCHLRPNQVDDERAWLLHNSGCISTRIALETASPRLRKLINREQTTNIETFEAAKHLRKYKIKLMIQNILCLPTATIEDDLNTLDVNIKAAPSYAWSSIFMPYPGTVLGDMCVEKGWYKGDYEDITDSFFDHSVLDISEEYREQSYYLQKCFALCVKVKEIPKPEELTAERFPALIHRLMRKHGDKKLYGGII